MLNDIVRAFRAFFYEIRGLCVHFGVPEDRAHAIMTLGVKHGDEVTLSTDDDNAGAVLDSLVELLSRDLDKE